MSDIKETGWDHISGNDYASFYTSEKKWINQILKLKESNPDEVEIIARLEGDEIMVHIPVSWLKIRPKRKSSLTAEQIAASAKRLEEYNKSRKDQNAAGSDLVAPAGEKGAAGCSPEKAAIGMTNVG